jgi:hypothetical protein
LLIGHSFGLQALPRVPLAQLGTLEGDAGQLEAEPVECASRGEVGANRNTLRLQPFSQRDDAWCTGHSHVDQPLKACFRGLETGPHSLVNFRLPQRRTVARNRSKRLRLGIGIDVLRTFCEAESVVALKVLDVPGTGEILVLAEINPAIKRDPRRDDMDCTFVVVGPNTVWMSG